MKIIPFISFLPFALLFCHLKAQNVVDTAANSHLQAVQLNIGTQGIGIGYAYGLNQQLALHAGINAIPIKANDVFKISGFNSTSHVSADFYNIHLLANYTPFQQLLWLRLVGGLSYFFKANGNVKIIPSDDYSYGDLTLTEDQIGYVNLNVDWKGLAPYLGIGLLRTFPKRKFNVNLDLGTYYLNKPKAHIIGTGLLAGNDSQSEQFQSNIKDYRWLPILQVNLNYKF